MPMTDILYIVLIVATVILTVTIVWLANEAIGLMKSLRKSADDTAVVTREFKEKVLLASEALDRVGTAAATVLGIIEEAVQGIKDKRDKLADGVAMVTGLGKYIKEKQKPEEDEEEDKKKESEAEAIVVPPKKPAPKEKKEREGISDQLSAINREKKEGSAEVVKKEEKKEENEPVAEKDV